ncbi:hypothetical protein [Nostoc sp.]|uniref:hypothetical protein n=1 Tax=Nostoc sp. TaxID=1180 RepID=UPI002FF9657A
MGVVIDVGLCLRKWQSNRKASDCTRKMFELTKYLGEFFWLSKMGVAVARRRHRTPKLLLLLISCQHHISGFGVRYIITQDFCVFIYWLKLDDYRYTRGN